MSRNQGKSYEEISKELGISISTVKSQMNKALETMRNFFKPHDGIL
jgi:RNA polymerase sigma-70 factor (ECF subfamily)